MKDKGIGGPDWGREFYTPWQKKMKGVEQSIDPQTT